MANQTTTSATVSATSTPPCPLPLIPNLPDDISLQILARVPRFHHPFLSLVSKSWRYTVNSPEFFHTRSLLRTAQSSLYLSLRIDSSFHWYAEQNPQNSKRSLIVLPSIPQHPVGSSILALGPKIYVIGGSINDIPSNNVWGGVVYDVGCGEWGSVPKRLDLGWRGRAAVVDKVLYCYDYLGKIRGYDVEEDVWKELRGVDKGLPKFLCSSTMVNLDGKLCVVWEGKGNGKEVDIMCAEIDVKRDVDGGLRGTILRLDVILVVPKGASISHCLAVEF
ncbi:UNVERIFIED_CONTAM: F-box/kelch-repeat protein SKIP6 [Sesamum calycinum]|uniref:F-box/kelch-repeat protein SKIP6 n=2 Tax=Sesamum TaxID=4181 RepID=A0AAW2SX29_9LAMI